MPEGASEDRAFFMGPAGAGDRKELEMREVVMRPGLRFPYRAEADILDYPHGEDQPPRKRCTINVDFARSDVEEMKAKGLDLAGCLQAYQDRLERTLRQMIGPDCVCKEGLDEMIQIIRAGIEGYFQTTSGEEGN